MKSLYTIILEAFKSAASHIDEVVRILKGFGFDEQEMNTIKSFVRDVFDIKDVMVLLPDNKEKYFKIARNAHKDVEELVTKYNPTITCDDGKIYFGKKHFATIGNGSIGQISTKDQENAPCIIWNALMEESINDPTSEAFEAVFNDAMGKINCHQADWHESFRLSVGKILDFIKSRGCEPAEYRMNRYGDGDIGTRVKSAMLTYTREMRGNKLTPVQRKDVYYPADVILYKEDFKGQIAPDRKSFVKLFDDNELFGISLKKASVSARCDVFNDRRNNVKVRIKKIGTPVKSNNTYTIPLHGSYAFAGEDESIINLTIRTFGSKTPYMDISLPGKPAIGKVPTNVWRKVLKVDRNVTLDDATDALNNLINNNSLSIFHHLINTGIKQGNKCLPFVLIH